MPHSYSKYRGQKLPLPQIAQILQIAPQTIHGWRKADLIWSIRDFNNKRTFLVDFNECERLAEELKQSSEDRLQQRIERESNKKVFRELVNQEVEKRTKHYRETLDTVEYALVEALKEVQRLKREMNAKA